MSKRTLSTSAVCIGFLCFSGFGLGAQELPAGSSVVQPGKEPARVRGWVFPGKDDKDVTLRALQPQAEAQYPLAAGTGGAAAVSPSYLSLPGGELVLELKSGNQMLSQTRVSLRDGRYYTAAAWRDGAKWTLKIYADGPASSDTTERPVRIFNFAAQRETVVQIEPGPEFDVAPNSVQDLKAPAKVGMVTVKVLSGDGGAPAESTVEVDLSLLGSAYVVVGPDYRGRMRPRVINGGEVRETVPSAQPRRED